MRLSIIVPTYNTERYLEKCLKSIAGQSYSDIELIVKDGGSQDNTLKIAKCYTDKVISFKDRGEPDAINYGFKQATGDILAYIDADDIYQHGAFNLIMKHFTAQPVYVCLF